MTEYKQVIVIRKDLKMTKGKMIAQGAHASLGIVLRTMKRCYLNRRIRFVMYIMRALGLKGKLYYIEENSPLWHWVFGIFAKICVYVESEEELIAIFRAANEAKLPVHLITDSGLTQFHGVATKTCLAIGPCKSEDVDKITGHLRLL